MLSTIEIPQQWKTLPPKCHACCKNPTCLKTFGVAATITFYRLYPVHTCNTLAALQQHCNTRNVAATRVAMLFTRLFVAATPCCRRVCCSCTRTAPAITDKSNSYSTPNLINFPNIPGFKKKMRPYPF